MIKVVHIITGLNTGGAEMMLFKLLSGMDRLKFVTVVISLMDKGVIGRKIEALGVPVHELGMPPGRPSFAALGNLVKYIKDIKPDLLQGWMYHGNLAALFARVCSPSIAPVLWNVRAPVCRLRDEKLHTALIVSAGAFVSGRAARIIYNSDASAKQHAKLGYKSARTYLIPNGFDCNLFCPSSEARETIRKLLGMCESDLIIGLVARYHAMKDHANFLAAAGQVSKAHPNVYFLMAGCDVTEENRILRRQITELGLDKKVFLLGERQDIPRLTAGLDIVSSSSWGEAFPNTIGEAMACGVPCAVTDVGESAYIVGNTGKVVPPRNPRALAAAWEDLIRMGHAGRLQLGLRARQRIKENFSLESVVARYEYLYMTIAGQSAGGQI